MPEVERNKWRDLVLIPIIVGVFVVFVQFILPKVFEQEKVQEKVQKEEKEISYHIDEPSSPSDELIAGDVKIVINGVEVESLYAYKISFWNSGDVPLKNISVRYMFEHKWSRLKILSTHHETTPKYEFGKITEQESEKKSKRFVYSLLNPGDKVNVTLICDRWDTLSFHTKAAGLSVKEMKNNDEGDISPKFLPENDREDHLYILPVIAIIASLLSILLLTFSKNITGGTFKFKD